MWGQSQGDLAALKFAVLRTSVEVVKISRNLLSSNTAFENGLEKDLSHEGETQEERTATCAKLWKANSGAHELVGRHKQQAESELSLQKLKEELKQIEAHLV